MAGPEREGRDLGDRVFAFAVRIVRLCQKLSERPGVTRMLSHQLFKAGTSIGSNYEEAQAGQSRADFISKNSISLKEARETRFWLKLLVASEIMPEELIAGLLDEAEQLAKIFGSIVSRSKHHES